MPTKNLRSRSVLVFATLILASCSGIPTAEKAPDPAVALQGPLDPSFEGLGAWVLNAQQTGFCGAGASLQSSRASIVTGTGFLPSAGVHYALLNVCNWLDAGPTASLYQDNVWLDRSKTLTFDYTLSGTLGAGGGGATVKILFTSNGTATLWTKSITNASTLPLQASGESVSLPATIVAGRLTIQLNVSPGFSGPGSTKSDVSFGIDNLVVK